LPEIPSFPISLAGPEHLYGAITVSGNSVFFSSAKDIIGNDLSKVVGTTGGATYQVNLSTASGGALDSQFAVSTVANFGGLAVYHNAASGKDYLLGMEVGKVANMQITSGGTPSAQQSLNSRGILYQLLSWMARFGL
jgi:type IV pilus assembly protein PilY1